MSGYSPVGSEILPGCSSYALGTTSVPTAAAVTITAGHPVIVIPAGYFKSGMPWASSLRLEMGGQISTAATIPTWNFSLFGAVATSSAPAFSTSVTFGTTGTFTPPSAVTNVQFMLTAHIGIRAYGQGAASTIVCFGQVVSTAVNAAGEVTIPAAGTYTPMATYDTSQAYVLWPGLTLGAATAGNTVTTHFIKLHGEN